MNHRVADFELDDRAGTRGSGVSERPADGHLLADVGIEHVAQLRVGLDTEGVQHLGEESASGGREHDVGDFGIAETDIPQLLHIDLSDRRRVSSHLGGEVDHRAVGGIETRTGRIGGDGAHRRLVAAGITQELGVSGQAIRRPVDPSRRDRGQLEAATVHVPPDRVVELVPGLGDIGPRREGGRVVREVAPRGSLPLVPVSDFLVDAGFVGRIDEHVRLLALPHLCRRLCPTEHGPVTTTEALGAWGAYDLDDPFPLFGDVAERGPVHAVTLADGHDAWLVVGYEEARRALNDPRLSKDMHAALATGAGVVAEGLPGPSFARHMLTVDPPDHTRLRRLVSVVFTPRRVEDLRPRVQSLVDDLLDDIAAAGPDARVDLVSSFAFPLPFTVICELLGVPESDRADLGRGLIALLVPTTTAVEYARAKEASDAVVAMLEALVETKQKAPGDDLVSGLVTARDGDERLTTQELLSTIFQLIVAGHDTTASLIGNGVVALLRHPQQLDEVRSGSANLAVAVEELLRYDAPVPHATFRYTVAPVDVGAVTIPAGAQVLISLAAANRDRDQYTNPDVLDIDRAESRHLAFGHGIHHCLGAPLARMEGQLALGSLLRRFPELRLAVPDHELHWGHGDGLVLRGLTELPVIPGPAAPRVEVENRP